MRISNITIPVFRGISVNNIEIKDDNKNRNQIKLRTRQMDEFEHLDKELKLLQELEKTKEVKSIEEIDSDAEDNNKISKFVQRYGWGTGKAIFLDKKAGTEDQKKVLGEKLDCTDRMIESLSKTIKKIKEIDKEEITNSKIKAKLNINFHNNKGISNIAGYNNEMFVIKKEFIDKVNREKNGEDINIPGSLLFFGPYGNGKTYITRKTAEETGCNIEKFPILTKKNIDKFMLKINEIAQKSEDNFKKDRTRTIIFIDEIDKAFRNNIKTAKDFGEFLKDCSSKYHCSVFAATNDPLDLNLDMDEPYVFPIKMSIDPPDENNAIEMFKYYLEQYPKDNIDYEKLEKELRKKEKKENAKFNNATINDICTQSWFNKQSTKLTQNDIINEIKNATPTLTKKLEDKFNNDYKQLIVN